MSMTVIFASFVALNLQEVISSDPVKSDSGYRVSLAVVLAITLVLCSIRKLADLSWIIVIATACEFYIIFVIFIFIFDGIAKEPDQVESNLKQHLFGPIEKWPLTFSMLFQAFAGIAVVFPLR